jgi:hypothetical protein
MQEITSPLEWMNTESLTSHPVGVNAMMDLVQDEADSNWLAFERVPGAMALVTCCCYGPVRTCTTMAF